MNSVCIETTNYSQKKYENSSRGYNYYIYVEPGNQITNLVLNNPKIYP